MKTVVLGAFLSLLIAGGAICAVAQSVDEQRGGVVEKKGGSDDRLGGPGVGKLDERDTARCQGIIAAVGIERTSKATALAAAHDAWIARVRFDYGERYTDLSNAIDASSVCTASTPVSPAVLIKKVYFRCKIWARPCPAATTVIEKFERRYEEEVNDDG
jgi:hypothetical protein